ncbi:MAG: F0F1 ATP synthase subunit delta [Gammaproteobacteria bacterium]|nr:F0F1 ATP synthase subunit delta [Gammaproteobacteria bacterium]
MQENLTVARPYAQAAYEQARAEGTLSAWSDALAYLAALVADEEMRRLINNPRVGRDRLAEAILDIAGSRFGDTFRNFVKVLSSAQRLGVAGEVAELFERHRADAENFANAEIVTAYPLAAEQETRIAQAVQRRLGREVRIRQRVDQNLIGGAVVRVGDSVFDLSLKGGLDQLANLFNWK